jgi:NAD(P)H dehydrogenase (quinone)
LESDCHERIYKLTGNKSYSFADVAASLTELRHKPVNFKAVEKSSYEAKLKERGLPEPVIQKISGFLTDIKNGQEEEVSSDLENLLGRKPSSLEQGIKRLFDH